MGDPVAVAGVWEAYEDSDSGVLYFYNTETQETQWEKPAAFAASPKPAQRTVMEWKAPRQEWKAPVKAGDANTGANAPESNGHSDGPAPKNTVVARLLVCTVAVALLWCTTFSVSKGLATTFLQSPGTQVVISSWDTVVAITEDEGRGYELCATLQTQACANRLERQTNVVREGSRVIQEQNQYVADNLTRLAESCDTQRNQMLLTFQNFINDNRLTNSIQWAMADGTEVCSSEDRSYITGIVGGSETRSTAYRISNAYVADTNGLVAETNEQIAKRFEYDTSYAANKTAQVDLGVDAINIVPDVYVPSVPTLVNFSDTFADVEACLTTNDTVACPYGIGSMPVPNVENLLLDMNNTITSVRATAAESIARVQAFSSQVQSAYAGVLSLFSTLSPIGDAIESAYSAAGLGSISMTGELKAVTDAFSNLVIGVTLPSLNAADILADIETFFSEARQNAKADLEAAQQRAKADVAASMEALALQVNATADRMRAITADYNPPNVTWREEEHDSNTDSFLRQQRKVLEQSNRVVEDTIASANSASANISFDFNLQLSSIAEFPWRKHGGSVELRGLVTAIDQLVFFLLLSDYLFRFVRSIQLAIKYWKYSAVGLSVVDVRKGETSTKGEPVSIRVARVVSSPFVVVGLASLLAILCISLFVDAYLPLYNDYSHGCVKTSQGTVFVNNTYSFSYNLAAYDGNRIKADQIKDYDVNRTELCTDLTDAAKVAVVEVQQSVENAKLSRNLSIADLELFDKCVDFDATFQEPRWTFYNIKQDPPDVLPKVQIDNALNGDCNAPAWDDMQLSTNGFNCSLLPPCVLTCSGPNQFLLGQASFEAACRTESLVHAGTWQAFASVIVFICINLSRIFAVMAIVRLFWRSLTPHGLTYVANCDRKGRSGEEVQKLLPSHVSMEVRSYEREAMLYLLIAMLLHIPYIVIFSIVENPLDASNNLAYSGNGLDDTSVFTI